MRRLVLATPLIAVLTLVSCGDIPEAAHPVTVTPKVVHTMSTPSTFSARQHRYLEVAKWRDTIRWDTKIAEARVATVRKPVGVVRDSPPTRVSAPSRPASALPSIAAVTTSTPTGGCWDLLRHYFGDVLVWATRIVTRESRCTAATNYREGCDTSGRTNSHAMGPWQICYPQHLAAFDAVGCHAPLDFDCNMRAARYLYNSEGRGPWGG